MCSRAGANAAGSAPPRASMIAEVASFSSPVRGLTSSVAINRARYVMVPSRRASNKGAYCSGKITVGISSAEMAFDLAITSPPSGRG